MGRPELGPVETMRLREKQVSESLAELRRAVHDGEWSVALAEAATLRGHLAALAPGGDDHLDFVHVVEVEGRDKPVNVFANLHDAQRFEAAVEAGDPPTDVHSPTYRFEERVIVGPAAERLIASERGDVVEAQGWPDIAQKIRDGAPPGAFTQTVADLELGGRLQRWAEEDARACTGAVVDGTVQHDGPTCPVHEEDAQGGQS